MGYDLLCSLLVALTVLIIGIRNIVKFQGRKKQKESILMISVVSNTILLI
jgi:hypothetical protein